MKILIYPHSLEFGGSQINAIELAAQVSQRGHEVILFGPNGALMPVVEELGLEYIRSANENSWPSRRNIAQLKVISQERSVDVAHGYEWGPGVELAFGTQLLAGVPVVTTIMSMTVPDFLPRHSPIVVGTAELAQRQRSKRSSVHLMEPPIDTTRNAPNDGRDARTRFGFDHDDLVFGIVCRLTDDLDKLQGVLAAISATEQLATTKHVRLLVVGDGPGLSAVRERAASVNNRTRHDVIVVEGGMLDPRDAYSATDVVLGMGSSAIKGMAFAKPLVVQGANGFWRLLDESSAPTFLKHGWYGANGRGAIDLESILRSLLSSRSDRVRLGAFGRELVVERFSLATASEQLIDIYQKSILTYAGVNRRDLAQTAYELAKFKIVRFGQEHDRLRPAAAPRPMARSGAAL